MQRRRRHLHVQPAARRHQCRHLLQESAGIRHVFEHVAAVDKVVARRPIQRLRREILERAVRDGHLRLRVVRRRRLQPARAQSPALGDHLEQQSVAAAHLEAGARTQPGDAAQQVEAIVVHALLGRCGRGHVARHAHRRVVAVQFARLRQRILRHRAAVRAAVIGDGAHGPVGVVRIGRQRRHDLRGHRRAAHGAAERAGGRGWSRSCASAGGWWSSRPCGLLRRSSGSSSTGSGMQTASPSPGGADLAPSLILQRP